MLEPLLVDPLDPCEPMFGHVRVEPDDEPVELLGPLDVVVVVVDCANVATDTSAATASSASRATMIMLRLFG